ncbi:MAG: DinB family protein [Candidatus Promineifilaceae bacterium]
MTPEQILDQLDASRERLLVAIEPLPDEALQAAGVMDDWSIADILSHLIAWESELVTALLRIDQGRPPATMLAAIGDVDGYNARRFAESKGRPLARIFDDLQGVRVQLESWLDRFSERELRRPLRLPWTEGITLSLDDMIRENSYGHELEHLPDIEAFAGRWLAEHGEAPAEEGAVR